MTEVICNGMHDQFPIPVRDDCCCRLHSPHTVNLPSLKRIAYLSVWFAYFSQSKCSAFHPESYNRKHLHSPKRHRGIQPGRLYTPIRVQSDNLLCRYSKLFRQDDSEKREDDSFKSFVGSSSQNATRSNSEQGDNSYEVEELEFVWEVGDVEEDFNNLEQAINFSQAENYLREAERKEMLDEFAAQRRLLLPDLRHFVTRTLRISAVLLFLKRFLKRSPGTPLQQAIYRLINVPFDVHFWAIVVAAPVIFLQIKRWTMPPPPPMPHELEDLGPEYRQFVKSDWWEDPSTSCRDYVLCLLEQWSTAVRGFVYFTLVRLCCAGVMRQHVFPLKTVPTFSDTTLAFIRLLTRLGAMASLFQYPELLFQLRRKQQPRPMKLDATMLQSLVKSLFRWGIPLGVATDISQVMIGVPPRLVIGFYGTMVAVLSAMEIMYNQQRKPNPPKTPPAETASKLRRKIVNLAMTMSISVISCVTAFLVFTGNFFRETMWLRLITIGVFTLAVVGPLCHLIAFVKLIRVVYTHGLSFSDPDAIHAKLSNPQEYEQLCNWRYRLEWRDPQRISVAIDSFRGELFYRLFVEGSIEDQLQEKAEAARRKSWISDSRNILNKLKRDIERNPNAPRPDRSQWKKGAMDKLADIFQKDYDANSVNHAFQDPLGVAVQQRLHIGLGFRFDHTRKLSPGEKPSIRRLQARAAKSAVQKATALLDERNRLVKELYDGTKDKEKRKEGTRRINTQTEEQIQYLAKRLSDLVPSVPCSFNEGDGVDTEIKESYLNNPLKMTLGENTEAEIVLPSHQDSRSEAIDSLMSSYEVVPSEEAFTQEIVDEFNRMQQPQQGNSTIPKEKLGTDDMQSFDRDDDILTDGERDEFVEAYLKQKFGGEKPRKDMGDDDEDDDMETIIV